MEQEIFKPIKGYEGLYEVSNLGRVKSLCKEWICGRNTPKRKEETIIRNGHRKDYDFVSLSKDKKIKYPSIHRLVAEQFIINYENKPDINHKDGNKRNNYFKNLEWCTKSENQTHAYKKGFQISKKGSQHHQSKLTENDVFEIKELCGKGGKSQREIGELYGIKQAQVSRIVCNKRWNHI